MVSIAVNDDCRHLKGDIPCVPHKEHGVHCDGCAYHTPVSERILIIKFDGLGDVIRTTPVLRKLKELHPNCEITWLSMFPEVLPGVVDCKLKFSSESMIRLMADEFDYLYNFDKRVDSCSLANLVKAKVKKGFVLKNGKCAPIDVGAQPKYLTGLFDDVSKSNSKNYVEEMFDIAGLKYNREKYWIDAPTDTRRFPKMKKPVIGLTTGSGARWLETRAWPEENWVALATELQLKGYSVVLLGGEFEHEKNLRIAARSGAHYFNHFPLKEFVALIDACDLVVTPITSTMHFAIALEKKIVAFVNIFPRAEFELYGLGEIIEPPKPCQCFFKSKCSVYPGSSCMKDITVGHVVGVVDRVLNISSPEL